jgi:hypothetical protein
MILIRVNRVGRRSACFVNVLFMIIHFVPHRERSMHPLEPSVGEGCVGETVARNLTNTLCGQTEELLMLSWAVHKYICDSISLNSSWNEKCFGLKL